MAGIRALTYFQVVSYCLPSIEALAENLRECQLRERIRRGATTFIKA
jgi:hypothetical protein